MLQCQFLIRYWPLLPPLRVSQEKPQAGRIPYILRSKRLHLYPERDVLQSGPSYQAGRGVQILRGCMVAEEGRSLA